MIKGKKVVILGGGFTGLRIAYLLNELGYRITLVERTGRLGGMVQTFAREHNGELFLFDFGPHLLFEDYLDEYRDLLKEDLISFSGRFRMCTEHSMLSYPLRPLEMITSINPITLVLYLLDFLFQRAKPKQSDGGNRSLDSFMIRRFGRKLFNDFYSPYIEKCCGLPSDEVSPQWGKERENVAGKSLMENIVKKVTSLLNERARKQLARRNDPSGKNITAWYPLHGSGQLCDAMARTLPPGANYLNTEIGAINVDGNTVRNVVLDLGGTRKTIQGDYYISTIPLAELFARIQPPFPGAAKTAMELKYRSVRLVNLIISKERVLDCLEIFSMNRRHIFKRIYEPKAMSACMSPPGCTSLCLEVCYNAGDEISSMCDDKLIARCVEDLMNMELVKSMDEVEEAFTVEMSHAYPIYRRDFERHRQELLDRIAAFNNLLTVGRQGLFRYHVMTNEVMEMAGSVVRFLEGDRDKTSADNRGSQWGQLFY